VVDLLSKFEQYQVHASDMGIVNPHISIIIAVGRGPTPFTIDPEGRVHDLTMNSPGGDHVEDVALGRGDTWTGSMVSL
jgi:hypothetical protein